MSRMVNVSVDGIDELNKTLINMKKNFSRSTNKLLVRMAEKVKTDVKMITPVDTGLLRNSWERTDVNNNSIVIYNNQEYAPYIEFGHRGIGGKGYYKGTYMLTRTIKGLDKEINELGSVFFDTILGRKK